MLNTSVTTSNNNATLVTSKDIDSIANDILRSSTPSKKLVWLLRLLSLAAIVSQVFLIARAPDALYSHPLTEDAFYALSVSRSLAQGHGITVDGIHPTNGVQPLICYVDAIAFLIAGDDMPLALRIVILLHVAIGAVASYVIALFMSSLCTDKQHRQWLFWLFVAAVQWNHAIRVNILNGLETGLSLAFVFGAAYIYNAHISKSSTTKLRWCLALGVVLGFGVLARIDATLLTAALILVHIGTPLIRWMRIRDGARMLLLTVKQSAIIGFVAIAVSLPWWIYNLHFFHSLMPISGQAQRLLIGERLADNIATTLGLVSDGILLIPFGHQSLGFNPLAFVGIAIVIIGLVIIRVSSQAWKRCAILLAAWRRIVAGSALLPIALFAIMLSVYYTFEFGAPHFLFRYLIVLRVLIVLVVLSLLYVLGICYGRNRYVQVVLGVLAVSWVASSAVLGLRDFSGTAPESYFAIAKWIEQNIHPSRSVGMFQSGTTGFYLPKQVVNLDGKVNAAALASLSQHRLPRYVDSLHIDYIVEWQRYIDENLLFDAGFAAHYGLITSVNGFSVWQRTDTNEHGVATQ